MSSKVIVVGGGLAGLTSALHLSQKGIEVLLIEKHAYPKHKVCGEYISNEVLPYLNSLGFNPFDFGAKKITKFNLSTVKNQLIKTNLPLGGFGISRYHLDNQLLKMAQSFGVKLVQATVSDIRYAEDRFSVETTEGKFFDAPLVIGAFGKRSNLDSTMQRAFMKKPSPYLAVKAHYKGNLPSDTVCLHNFEGGYCGISMVENDCINVCYISDYKSFKRHKDVVAFEKEVLSKNKFLKNVFSSYDLVFEKRLTISQVSFASKEPVEDHILMCGDSAGMIHPLAGNGMSMAIGAAQVLSELILKYDSGKIKSRKELENRYAIEWNKKYRARLKSGHIIARLFRLGVFSEVIMLFLKLFPFILPIAIKKTHGKPLERSL